MYKWQSFFSRSAKLYIDLKLVKKSSNVICVPQREGFPTIKFTLYARPSLQSIPEDIEDNGTDSKKDKIHRIMETEM